MGMERFLALELQPLLLVFLLLFLIPLLLLEPPGRGRPPATLLAGALRRVRLRLGSQISLATPLHLQIWLRPLVHPPIRLGSHGDDLRKGAIKGWRRGKWGEGAGDTTETPQLCGSGWKP